MRFLITGVVTISALLVGAKLLTPQAHATPTPFAKGEWINGEVSSLKGRVTVLHFWTFGCINCRHNLPYYNRWASSYDPKEVQVIGIHTPELDFEKKPENVREAVKKVGIKYPVLIDAKAENWNRYHVEAWPTVFIIDKKGEIRKSWVGELQWNGQDGFGQLSKTIDSLRQEKG